MYFCNQNRPNIKESNPEAKFSEIGKLMGQKWKELSPEEKKPYEASALHDKKRYQDELARLGPSAEDSDSSDDDDNDDDDDNQADDEKPKKEIKIKKIKKIKEEKRWA